MSRRIRLALPLTNRAILLVALIATGTACPKKPPAAPPPTEPPPVTAPPEMPQEQVQEAPIKPVTEPAERAEDIDAIIRQQNTSRDLLKTVYFEFDKSDIGDEQVEVLRANGAWLRAHPQYKVLVEGHCDERDTIEYNLHLGERRAQAVRQYLIDLGIPASRLRAISYGEERPANPGHAEEAWTKNRRAEFSLEK